MRPNRESRHGPRRAASSRDRKVDTRSVRLAILIVCEGQETEPNYFKALIAFHQLNTVTVDPIEVLGAARQGPALIRYALGLLEKSAKKYDEVWCVFDKDSLTAEDFNKAITQANNHPSLKVAWTNEAFELWYVLHFEYLDHAPTHGGRGVTRDWYEKKLDELLCPLPLGRSKYNKADRNLYRDLGTKRRDMAIKNAIKLQDLNKPHGTRYHQCVPGTTVHVLVQRLLKLAPDYSED